MSSPFFFPTPTGLRQLPAKRLDRSHNRCLYPRHYPDHSPNLICVDADSRACPATEAEERAAAATRALLAAGAEWIYKKVDSVLRGNVAAEVTAMMREAGAPLALLVPANPSLGRVIRDGHYFVHGQPLHETEFARDPGHPRISSSVLALLGLGGRVQVQSCRPGKALPASGIVVGDVGGESDLHAWAAQWRPGMLLAGGAEFFGAALGASQPAGLIRRALSNRIAAPEDGRTPGRVLRTGSCAGMSDVLRELFVCGSTSGSCWEFVERARTLGVPVFGLPEKLARGGTCGAEELEAIAREASTALNATGRAVLAVGLPFVVEREEAEALASHLVTVAAAVLRQTAVGHVCA